MFVGTEALELCGVEKALMFQHALLVRISLGLHFDMLPEFLLGHLEGNDRIPIVPAAETFVPWLLIKPKRIPI